MVAKEKERYETIIRQIKGLICRSDEVVKELRKENETLKRKLNVYVEENAVMASRIERQANLLGIGNGEGNV